MDIETATARPRSPVSAEVTARGHTAIQDKPAESGGRDEGMMASEHLLVALLSCQLSTFHKVAAKRKSPARVERVQGDLVFGGGDIERVRLRFELDTDEPDEKVASLLRLTDRACTISKVLSVPVEARFERV